MMAHKKVTRPSMWPIMSRASKPLCHNMSPMNPSIVILETFFFSLWGDGGEVVYYNLNFNHSFLFQVDFVCMLHFFITLQTCTIRWVPGECQRVCVSKCGDVIWHFAMHFVSCVLIHMHCPKTDYMHFENRFIVFISITSN